MRKILTRLTELRRWFGPAGFLAAAVFVGGRVLMEPLRRVPHYDSGGMEAYDAVEVFSLKKRPAPFKVAVLGSSITLWAVIEDQLATDLGLVPGDVRRLATPGGSNFDMWNMVRYNSQRFEDVKLVVAEVNPFILQSGLDDDPRIRFTISQHATLGERLLIHGGDERRMQLAEWVLPLQSVRRNLRSAFLNVADPPPGWKYFPDIAYRTQPARSWNPRAPRVPKVQRPDETADRLFADWRPSDLQEKSLRDLCAWCRGRGITVVLQQLPLHPAVARAVTAKKKFAKGLERYTEFVDGLNLPAAVFLRELDATAVGIPPEGMHDTTHYNRIGAEIYTRYLAGQIKPHLDAALGGTADGDVP